MKIYDGYFWGILLFLSLFVNFPLFGQIPDSLLIIDQNQDSLIEIGKKPPFYLELFFKHKGVREENFDEFFWPIYFKRYNESEFKRVGFLGGNIKSFLMVFPDSKNEYNKFKRKRILSIVSFGTSYFLTAVALADANNLINLPPIISGYPIVFAAPTVLSFSIYYYLRADLNLLIGVKSYNRHYSGNHLRQIK